MTEQLPEGIPDVYEGIADALLTPEEVNAVLTQADHGIQPVAMREFESLEQFVQGSNNFHLMFTAKPGLIAWYLNRGKRAHQRFELLYPELDQTTTSRVQPKGFSSLDNTDQQLLYECYQKMSLLVDARDGEQVQSAAEVGAAYLIR